MPLPPVLARPRIWLLVGLVVIGLAQAAAAVATAVLVHLTFDKVINAALPALDLLLWIGVGLAAMAGLHAWLRLLERTSAERMGQDYINQVRMVLFDHLSASSVRAMQRRSRGGLMLRFIGDLKAVKQWISLGLARLTVGCVSSATAMLALSLVNWVLSLTASLVLIAGVVIAVYWGRRTHEVIKEARRRLSYLAGNVNEKIASMAVVQVFGQSQRERDHMARQAVRLQDAMVAQARATAQLRCIADCTAAVASGAVLVMGAQEVWRGHASAATVVAAMTIIGLLVPALRDFGLVYTFWQGAQVSRQKISEFLSTPSLVNTQKHAPDLKPGPGRLEFVDVSVQGALQEFSAVAEAGQVIAIVGPNGAGKSTLLALAARLIDPDTGRIILDGQDLKEHSLVSVRRGLGMVSPDLPLLRGTVKKNLRYRWRDASNDEFARVKSLCEIDETLAELPEGVRTRLTEDGRNLSPGQRQRIALARALLGAPAVLLLDEADSNLDPKSSAIVDRVLAQFQGTVLIVTHRYDRLAMADRIWHLENGKLIETGTPADILRAHGPTTTLFQCDARFGR